MFGIYKFAILLLQILVFSFVYLFLDDSHFSGINRLEEMIKDEIISRKIKPFVKIPNEGFVNPENAKNKAKSEVKDIKEKAIEIKTDFEEEAVISSLAKPTISRKFFNRLYFSFVTGSSLGYGDLAPRSDICRLITMIQLIVSILIVLL